MFCRLLTFSDGALYYEVGSTTCSLSALISRFFFMKYIEHFQNDLEHISRVQHIFLYHLNAHFILGVTKFLYYKYTSSFNFCRTTKVNRSTKSVIFTHLKKA